MAFGPDTALTEAELLEVLERNLDDGWIGGLLEDPSSLSMFNGMAAVCARVQAEQDENFGRGAFILTAPGPAPATTTLRLTRNTTQPATTVPTTLRFVDERGAVWRPAADVAAASNTSPTVQNVDVLLASERTGYFLNSFEALTFVALDILPDGFSLADGGVAIKEATGGTSNMLGLHGSERDCLRASGETDDAYRHRMLLLEEKVSPLALTEVLIEVLDAYDATKVIADQIVRDGLRALREPFQDSEQPARRGLMGLPPFFLDDGYLDDPEGDFLRTAGDAMVWFEVSLPTPVAPDEDRLFLDDGYLDDPLMGFMDTPLPDSIALAIAALADELNRRRAGGVPFAIYLGLDQHLDRQPPEDSLSQAGDWTAAGADAPASREEALADFDGDDSYVVSTQGRAAGFLLTAGDLTFTFPKLFRGPSAVRYVRLACWARRGSTGGTAPQLAFLIAGNGASTTRTIGISGVPFLVDHEDWREYEVILEQNPDTALAWAVADVAGSTMVGGVANAAAVGATDQLRVSELRLDIVASFG